MGCAKRASAINRTEVRHRVAVAVHHQHAPPRTGFVCFRLAKTAGRSARDTCCRVPWHARPPPRLGATPTASTTTVVAVVVVAVVAVSGRTMGEAAEEVGGGGGLVGTAT